MIVFDALNHTYTEDGALLPSVTTVLAAEGFYDPRQFAPGSADRGTGVHLITQLLDEGMRELASYTLDPLYPYALAWEKFKQHTGAEFIGIEVMVGGKELGAAGMVDRFAEIRRKLWLLDIKSGYKMAWHPIQTAGYKYLSRRSCRRGSVYLKDTGKYELVEHAERYDEVVWKAALITHRWKREYAA